MISAVNGNRGYIGALKGLFISGSFFFSCKYATIETIYNTNAPKQANVIISAVFPVNKATIPTSILTNSAFAGVLNLLWIFPRYLGAYPTLPNYIIALPPAKIIPWKEAIKPSNPIPINNLYSTCELSTICPKANGSGESEATSLPSG